MAGKGQTVPSNKIGTLGNYGRSHCQAAYCRHSATTTFYSKLNFITRVPEHIK